MAMSDKPPIVAAAPVGGAMSAANLSTAETTDDEKFEREHCAFMCCLCKCSERTYRDLTCFGCFPVKCGIYCIALFSIALTVAIFAETFMMLMSDQIHWWFVLVSVLLQIPLIIGLIFFLGFFGEDSNSTRGKLDVACYLAIISFALQVIWNISYFYGLYKFQTITIGNDESFTFTVTKKQYLFWTSFAYAWFTFFYGYFICVCRRYWYRLKEDKDEGDDEEMEAMMMNMA